MMFAVYSLISFACSLIFFAVAAAFAWCKQALNRNMIFHNISFPYIFADDYTIATQQQGQQQQFPQCLAQDQQQQHHHGDEAVVPSVVRDAGRQETGIHGDGSHRALRLHTGLQSDVTSNYAHCRREK